MIYYFSKEHIIKDSRVTCCNPNTFTFYFNQMFYGKTILSLDTETSGLDTLEAEMLLLGIGTAENQFIFDYTSFYVVKPLLMNEKIKFLAHNMKYDLGILKSNLDVMPRNVWCTMIADQRLYQGYGKSKHNPTGISFGLVPTSFRHTKKTRTTGKDSVSSFIGQKQTTYVPITGDLIYLSEDINTLHEVFENQVRLIKMYDLVYQQNFEQPLVRVLAKMEDRGIGFDTKAWSEVTEGNKELAFKYACLLDDFVRTNLEDLPEINRQSLKYEFRNNRYLPPKVISTDLFGNPIDEKIVFSTPKTKKIEFNKTLINWASSDQVIRVLALMELPVPIKDDSFLVPIFDNKWKVIDDRGLNKRDLKKWKETKDEGYLRWHTGYSVGVPKLKNYIKQFKNKKLTAFIELYLKFSDASNKVSNFGDNYIQKISPKTGKIHTIYRQCDSTTSRLQSGGGKRQPNKFNSQNIPRKTEYRSCFIAGKGRKIMTIDLTGAEVVILADKSNDRNVIRMAIQEDDIHSPVATACWRNIYLWRAYKQIGLCCEKSSYDEDKWKDVKTFWKLRSTANIDLFKHDDKAKDLFSLYREFLITKKINTNLRGDFKAITFGVAYGAYAATVSKALNISLEEAQITIDTIKSMMPDVFNLIEKNVNFVFGRSYKETVYEKAHGYMILNPVSKSRLYFPRVLDCINQNIPIDFYVKKDLAGVARNAPIQGTQADMVKEAMVNVDKYFEDNKIDAYLLMQVHDELVIDIPEELEHTLPPMIEKIILHICNKYLTNIKMKAEWGVEDFWKK